MIALIKQKIDYVVVSAPQWKSFVGISKQSGVRKTQKQLSVSIVQSRYGITCKKDDIADSILIGTYVTHECIKEKASEGFSWDMETY